MTANCGLGTSKKDRSNPISREEKRARRKDSIGIQQHVFK